MSTTNEYGKPTYQPPPLSQPLIATTSNVTAITTAPVPVTQMSVASVKPSNYLVLNIITLVSCCFIFGLVGLMYSLQVDSEWDNGNHQEANNASRNARNWGIAGIITGAVLGVGFLIFIIVISVTVGGSSDDGDYDY